MVFSAVSEEIILATGCPVPAHLLGHVAATSLIAGFSSEKMEKRTRLGCILRDQSPKPGGVTARTSGPR